MIHAAVFNADLSHRHWGETHGASRSHSLFLSHCMCVCVSRSLNIPTTKEVHLGQEWDRVPRWIDVSTISQSAQANVPPSSSLQHTQSY